MPSGSAISPCLLALFVWSIVIREVYGWNPFPISSGWSAAARSKHGPNQVSATSQQHRHPFRASCFGLDLSSKSDEEFEFEENSVQQRRKRSNRWIVLVDDDESIRTAVGQLLYDHGFQVTACADAMTALKVSTSRRQGMDIDSSALPDCIVSDVRMPKIDGLQFLQQIRSNQALVGIPVVLLTAKSSTRDRITGYDLGADAYVTKPFDPDELIAIVDNLITRRVLLSGADLDVSDIKQDLSEMKQLIMQGGGGIGNGWVKATDVFLSEDEQSVLDRLCEGLSNKEIADATYLSTRRVEQIMTKMFRKTETKNRTELMRWALSTGNSEV